jgi:hypothetical protein
MDYLLGAGGWAGAGMVGAPDGAGALPPQELQPVLQDEHPQVCVEHPQQPPRWCLALASLGRKARPRTRLITIVPIPKNFLLFIVKLLLIKWDICSF